jgi:DNA-binding HxlR family transcriptional regulator
VRAGAFGLSLISDLLDAAVLQALEQGPRPLIELRRALGSPPETTLRKHLKRLAHLGIVVRTQGKEFPAPVSYELSPSGRELIYTAQAVSTWLAAAPRGPLQIGTPAARNVIKALVDGWTTKILRALAARPLSLTELDRLLSGVNYPALERRLSAMRSAGQIVPGPGRNGSTPYSVTKWLREAVRPLAAAANWEHRHGVENCPPLGRLDIETLFLLATPLLDLPTDLKGSCRLAVDLSNGRQQTCVGTVVTIERGRAVSCVSDLRAHATSSAVGPTNAWLNVLSGRGESNLEFDGDDGFGDAVVGGLPRALLP